MHAGDIFELLRDGRPWTRAELADATGLARSTIAARIDVLMRLELVAPFGGARSTGGRPPALFALNPAARVVVGVDVGATHVRAAMADLSGEILGEVGESLDVAEGPEVVLGWVSTTVRALLKAQRRPLKHLAAIGIGPARPGRARDRPARSARRSCRAGTSTTSRDASSASTPCPCSSTTTSTSWRSASSRCT